MAIRIGALASTTIDNYLPAFRDNVFKKRALLSHFKNNGGVETKDGGLGITAPLIGGKNTTAKAFTGADTLDISYQEGIDSAKYAWAFYNTSITFTLTDELQNSGKSQMLSLLKGKIMQAENSIAELVNTDLFTGKGADTAGKPNIVGLDIALGTATYGGINPATTGNGFWKAYVGLIKDDVNFAALRTAKNTANLGAGGSRVSLIVTTQALYEKIMGLLTATISMNPTSEGKRLGDAGFANIEFEGTPVVFEESATAETVYMVNVTNWKLGVLKGANFDRIKKSEPATQHMSVSHIVAGLQLYTDRRASGARLVFNES
jgi:hypothetical protein